MGRGMVKGRDVYYLMTDQVHFSCSLNCPAAILWEFVKKRKDTFCGPLTQELEGPESTEHLFPR